MLASTWKHRPELALPSELLHKVIFYLLRDSIHTLCASSLDTTWEANIMETLYQVSPEFRDISNEIAAKAFDLSKIVREDNDSLHQSVGEMFRYLAMLGKKSWQPADWNTTSLETIDCTAPSFVFAYALYIRSLSFRRSSTTMTPEAFIAAETVILSSLKQSEALCTRVFPVEMTHVIHDKIQIELDLACHGFAIVRECKNLKTRAESTVEFQGPSLIRMFGTGPIAGLRAMIHTSLEKLEAVHPKYTAALLESNDPCDVPFYGLPGVRLAIEKIGALAIDQYDIQPRIARMANAWPLDPPTSIEGGELLPTIPH